VRDGSRKKPRESVELRLEKIKKKLKNKEET
jgi:hypothetical protein